MTSFTKVPTQYLFDPNLTSQEFRCLCVLLHFSGSRGKAWPAQATVAKHLGVSQSVVTRVFRSLEAKGYITASVRKDAISRKIYALKTASGQGKEA
jgi:DNA-binding MarR family transcriptional regulator